MVKVAPRRWLDLHDEQGVTQWVLHFNRTILSYPTPEPDPRDSDGPGSDEGGGEPKGGDDDTDGDVPEVAHRSGGRSYFGEPPADTRDWAVAYPGDMWRVLRWFTYRGAADLACDDFPGAKTIRLYWPPTCHGAEDAPRDNFPDSPQEKAP